VADRYRNKGNGNGNGNSNSNRSSNNDLIGQLPSVDIIARRSLPPTSTPTSSGGPGPDAGLPFPFPLPGRPAIRMEVAAATAPANRSVLLSMLLVAAWRLVVASWLLQQQQLRYQRASQAKMLFAF